MILESKYQAWLEDKTVEIEIVAGKVDYERMVAVLKNKETLIKRTSSNTRARPDAGKRHENNLKIATGNDNNMNLVIEKDLEWLAWNWRGHKNQKKFKSRRLMTLEFYNNPEGNGFLPTPNEILHGIIQAQIAEYSNWQA